MSRRSLEMDLLYGETEAARVFDRINALDVAFNEEIQRIAYDRYWARPGLSLEQKSVITVAALVALDKAEQLSIHLRGLANVTSSVVRANGLVNAITLQVETTRAQIRTTPYRTAADPTREDGATESENNWLISVAIAVAIGNQSHTESVLRGYLAAQQSMATLRDALIHLIVYCGFPAVMNGFIALDRVRGELPAL